MRGSSRPSAVDLRRARGLSASRKQGSQLVPLLIRQLDIAYQVERSRHPSIRAGGPLVPRLAWLGRRFALGLVSGLLRHQLHLCACMYVCTRTHAHARICPCVHAEPSGLLRHQRHLAEGAELRNVLNFKPVALHRTQLGRLCRAILRQPWLLLRSLPQLCVPQPGRAPSLEESSLEPPAALPPLLTQHAADGEPPARVSRGGDPLPAVARRTAR